MKSLSTRDVVNAIRESMDIEEEHEYFDDGRLSEMLLDDEYADMEDLMEDPVEFFC